MPETRWRMVQVIDEAWHLEVRDPDYKAPLETKHLYGFEDGWRPKAVVWMWEYPSKTKRPWRASIGDPRTNRDYTTLDRAKRFTERRVL